MKRGNIIILAMVLVLSIASGAWALPVAGTSVKMENDWKVPYTMTDASGNEYGTFCLEKYEYFTPGNEYYVDSVGEYAIGGGFGADDLGRDKVEAQSKWLYAAFMSDVFIGLEDAAQKVQNAIWFWESEDSAGRSDWDILSGYKFDDSGWSVLAVNLSSFGDDDIQSQLVGVAPVPEPATLLLLGTGLLGLAGVSRKKFKQS